MVISGQSTYVLGLCVCVGRGLLFMSVRSAYGHGLCVCGGRGYWLSVCGQPMATDCVRVGGIGVIVIIVRSAYGLRLCVCGRGK